MPVTLTPKPPFVWPEARSVAGVSSYQTPPLLPFLSSAHQLFGILYDVDSEGIQWLSDALRQATSQSGNSNDLRCKLVIGVYAACQTKEEDLRELYYLQQEWLKQLELRVLATHLWSGAPTNTLSATTDEYPSGLMMVGPSPIFKLSGTTSGQINFVFRPDAALFQGWQNWFNLTWSESTPLTLDTIKIPALVPAAGTPEAAAMWRAYLAQLQRSRDLMTQPQEQATVNAETGVVTVKDAAGRTIETATSQLSIPQPDPLVERIGRLYQQGQLVTVDKKTRIPPFKMPIKPEWFDIKAREVKGAIARTTKLEISAFPEKEAKQLEAKRSKTSNLLRELSLNLADGTRWMPDAMWELFQGELDRQNEEGTKAIQDTIGNDIAAFMKRERKRIEKDAAEMYRGLHPNAQLPSLTVDKIMDALRERLEKQKDAQFLPSVSRARLSFTVDTSSFGKPESKKAWEDPWAPAAQFVYELALYPRKAASDGKYFLRGFGLRAEEVLDAMNLVNDFYLKLPTEELHYLKAKEEVARLESLRDAVTDNRKLCELLLEYMSGSTSWESIATTAGLADPD